MKRRAQSARPQRPAVAIGPRPVQKGANRLIDSYWEEKKQKDHLKRLKNVKSIVDCGPPVSMTHIKKDYKRKEFDKKQREKLIQKENVHLIRQILDVDGKQERVRKETYYRHPNRNEQTSMQYIRSAQEQHRISQENRAILTRIVSAKSQYNVHKWEEDYYKKIALVNALHEGNYNVPPSRPISAINRDYVVGGKPVSSRINSRYSKYREDDGDMDEDEIEEILFERRNNKGKEDKYDDERIDFSRQRPTPKIPSSSSGVRSKSAMSKQRPFSAHPSLIPQQQQNEQLQKNENNMNKPPLYKKKKATRPFSANYPSSSAVNQSRDYDDVDSNNEEMKYYEINNRNDDILKEKENENDDNDDEEILNYNVEMNSNPNEDDLTNQMDNLSLNLYSEQEQERRKEQEQKPSIPPLQIDSNSQQNQYNNYYNNYEYKQSDNDVESLMKDSPLPSNRDISPRRKDNNNISPIVSPKKSRNLENDDEDDDNIDDLLKPDVSFNDQLYNNNKPTLSNPSTPNTQRSHNLTDNEMKLSERKEEDNDNDDILNNNKENDDDEEKHSLVRVPSQRNRPESAIPSHRSSGGRPESALSRNRSINNISPISTPKKQQQEVEKVGDTLDFSDDDEFNDDGFEDDFGSTKGTTVNATENEEKKEGEEEEDNNQDEDEEFDDYDDDYNSSNKVKSSVPDYMYGNTEEPSTDSVEDLNGDEDWLK